jgi:hypothetical protein
VAGWQTETPAASALLGRPSSIRVALRAPGRRFGTPVEVARLGENDNATSPAVAVNSRGDAAIAWEQQHDTGSRFTSSSAIYLAYRRAGGSFGAPEAVARFRSIDRTGYNPTVAIDGRGDATVLFDADGKRVVTRPAGGRPGSPKLLGGGGGPARLIEDASGHQVAFWLEAGFETVAFAAAREPGRAFPAARRLAGDVFWSEAGLDAEGNLLLLGVTGPPQQQPRAGVYSRFGLVAEQVATPPSASPAGPLDLAVNDRGTAVALYSILRQGSESPLMALERPADRSAPKLRVAGNRVRGRRISPRVRCDERCRASVVVRVAGSRRALTRRRGRAARTLRRGARARLSTRLTRQGRRRLRRAVRRRGAGVRALSVVRAEDAAGNARRRVRRVRASALLR